MHTEKMLGNTANVTQQDQSMSDTAATQQHTEEIGGVKGPEPTRFGDWEKNGRCVDF